MFKYNYMFFITGYRRVVKVGWAMGERQKRNHVLTSFANHLHLPNDFQLPICQLSSYVLEC